MSGTRHRRESSSSEESELRSDCAVSGNKKIAVPSKASDWKNLYLAGIIGVHYSDVACSLEELMSRIHNGAKDRSLPTLPGISRKLIDFTDNIWRVTLDLKEATLYDVIVAGKETDDCIDKLKLNESAFKEQLLGDNEKTIFEVWKGSMLYFWANLKRLLARWSNPGQREASFTHLFMLFSRICLLDPETGAAYSSTKLVRGTHVECIPDVRFNSLPQDGNLVLIVTKVKKYDAFRGDFNSENFCADNIGSDILGQHGMELIVEAHNSFFAPCVVGMICIGTKVIFTYLDITRAHLSKIEKNRSIGLKSTISYTRPFDFMDVRDRKEMLETMFWFGYLQSGSYQTFIQGDT